MSIDEQIKALGYEEHVRDISCSYIVYENKEEDTEVTIEWNDDDQYCLIFVNTISREKNWFGQLYRSPMALTCKEYELFIAKIKETRES